MRARLAILSSGTVLTHREILLRDKPDAMLEASPKGTVPVLVMPDGKVLDESFEVMLWALHEQDPEDWLAPWAYWREDSRTLIAQNDGPFKHHLDRYKYETRYEGADALEHRAEGAKILHYLNDRLAATGFLYNNSFSLLDAAILPFVRQFRIPDSVWFDGQDWPHLHKWLQDFLASKRFAIVMKKYPVWNGVDDLHTFPEMP